MSFQRQLPIFANLILCFIIIQRNVPLWIRLPFSFRPETCHPEFLANITMNEAPPTMSRIFFSNSNNGIGDKADSSREELKQEPPPSEEKSPDEERPQQTEQPSSRIPTYDQIARYRDLNRPPDTHYPPDPSLGYRRNVSCYCLPNIDVATMVMVMVINYCLFLTI